MSKRKTSSSLQRLRNHGGFHYTYTRTHAYTHTHRHTYTDTDTHTHRRRGSELWQASFCQKHLLNQEVRLMVCQNTHGQCYHTYGRDVVPKKNQTCRITVGKMVNSGQWYCLCWFYLFLIWEKVEWQKVCDWTLPSGKDLLQVPQGPSRVIQQVLSLELVTLLCFCPWLKSPWQKKKRLAHLISHWNIKKNQFLDFNVHWFLNLVLEDLSGQKCDASA